MKLHHVNIPIPAGRSEQIAAFYCDVLGFERIPRPDNGRDGVWLSIGGAGQLHLSEREGSNQPQTHFAVAVGDLDAVRVRLAQVGAEYQPSDDAFGCGGRGFTRDPAGNRVELIAGSPD
jgi:catechol 2,3-dioxygenase-like lactoylglutathione lyase family enzyme